MKQSLSGVRKCAGLQSLVRNDRGAVNHLCMIFRRLEVTPNGYKTATSRQWWKEKRLEHAKYRCSFPVDNLNPQLKGLQVTETHHGRDNGSVLSTFPKISSLKYVYWHKPTLYTHSYGNVHKSGVRLSRWFFLIPFPPFLHCFPPRLSDKCFWASLCNFRVGWRSKIFH